MSSDTPPPEDTEMPDEDLGYGPPDEIELAERAVLGDVVVNPHAVRELAGIISPSDFRDIRLGQLYGLIVGMVAAGGPETVTAPTVIHEVGRRKAEQLASPKDATRRHAALWLKPAEVVLLVGGVHSGFPTPHARMIREASVLRHLAAHGRRLTQLAEGDTRAGELAAWNAEQSKAIRDGSITTGLQARLLADVFADADDGYDWLIPGLLERADRLVYTGAEGAGKSTFGRQMALCAAAGMHPFQNRRFEPLDVLVIDAENSEKQWRRQARGIAVAVRQIAGVEPAQRVHLVCRGRMDVTTPQGIGAVHQLLDEHQPRLLLIGPLYKLVPRAITNDDDATPVLAALDSLRERTDRPALMMEAHAGHALGRGGERDYRPRGSAALLGWPEFGFGFAPDHEDPARVQVIRWRGDREERDWPLALRRGGRLPWTNDAIPPGEEDRAPVTYLDQSQPRDTLLDEPA